MRSLISAKQKGNQTASSATDSSVLAKTQTSVVEKPALVKDAGKSLASKFSPTPSKKSSDVKLSPRPSPSTKKKPMRPDTDADGNAILQLRNRSVALPVSDNLKSVHPDTDPPRERIKLEWVYGYSGNDSRSNIHVIRSKELAYPVGSVVVLYNMKSHTQRHYREHSHYVKCLTLHSNGVVLASGQSAALPEKGNMEAKAQVRVWRSDTLQTLHILGVDTLQETVLCVSFSKVLNTKKASLSTSSSDVAPDTRPNDWVCAIDKSDGHAMLVSEVTSGKIIAHSSMDMELVCDCDFSPHFGDVIIVIGKEHIGWWKVKPETCTVELLHKAEYQNYLRAKYITSLLHTEKGDLVTGDSNGTVYVWGSGGNLITNLIKHVHDGPVFSLLMIRGTLLCGGRDSTIHSFVWGKNMDKIAQIMIPEDEGGVRMLVQHDNQLIIGTTTNSILTVTLDMDNQKQLLMDSTVCDVQMTLGHFDQTHSVCIPRSTAYTGYILTAGQDGNICMFDAAARKPVWKHFLKGLRVLCADINTGCTLLAVGTRDLVLVYGIGQDNEAKVVFEELCRVTTGTSRLTTIKLSPDCDTVAVGDKRGRVSVYGVVEGEDGEEEWEHLATWSAHTGPVTAIDWSMEPVADDCDEYYLRTCSPEATELRFWHSDTGERVEKLTDVKNTQWSSHHVSLTYDLYGIWHSKQAKDATVNCIDIHPSGEIVSMGDSNGYISLFRYPCVSKGAFCHTYKTRREVVKTTFTLDGRALFVIGGPELSIMQWAITGT